MKKNSIKGTRINAEVQKALSQIINFEIKDPRIHPVTTVTEVNVTKNLETCTVYISVLGEEKEARETLLGLESAAGYIRKELAHKVNLRNTPELRFVLDTSLSYGIKMSKMIDEVMEKQRHSTQEDYDNNIE